MSDIQKLTQKILKFRDDRDWKKFHNPKDVSLSLVLEAGEVMEHFQWKNDEEIKEYVKTHKEEIGDELADVFNWVMILSHDLHIDIIDAVEKKIKQNENKYPVEKAKGRAVKYNKL
ncbi:MAG: nucleotide pyrophosphohydrolase [Candidatus Magasanikbacteria bacterium]